MGISTAIAGLELASESKEPIRITGVPGLLHGSVHLQNTTDSKLTLKSLLLEAPALRNEALQPLREVNISARLYPGEQGNIHFEFPVAASTPPGVYEAEIQVGNQTRTVQIQINPFVEISLSPDEITLYTEGNNQFEMEFSVTNEGNIPVNMGNEFTAFLQTESGLEGQLQRALSVACNDKDEDSDPLKTVLCSLAQQQLGEITMSWDNSSLKPGETLSLKSSIELPDNLPPNRYYFAEVEILSENLQVDIYTYGAKK